MFNKIHKKILTAMIIMATTSILSSCGKGGNSAEQKNNSASKNVEKLSEPTFIHEAPNMAYLQQKKFPVERELFADRLSHRIGNTLMKNRLDVSFYYLNSTLRTDPNFIKNYQGVGAILILDKKKTFCCTATLLNQNTIITATHCIPKTATKGLFILNNSEGKILFRPIDLNTKNDFESRDISSLSLNKKVPKYFIETLHHAISIRHWSHTVNITLKHDPSSKKYFFEKRINECHSRSGLIGHLPDYSEDMSFIMSHCYVGSSNSGSAVFNGRKIVGILSKVIFDASNSAGSLVSHIYELSKLVFFIKNAPSLYAFFKRIVKNFYAYFTHFQELSDLLFKAISRNAIPLAIQESEKGKELFQYYPYVVKSDKLPNPFDYGSILSSLSDD